MNDSLAVTGPIVREDSTEITISCFNSLVTYKKSEIQQLDKITLPDRDLMQKDIVENTSSTANILGFELVAALIAVVVALTGAK